MKRREFLRYMTSSVLLSVSGIASTSQAHSAPPVMLANNYDESIELTDYWISEKYDGVRAWWTGRELLTRSGNPVHAPAWFTAGWPVTPMDGELWIARGQFESVSGTVRHEQPVDTDWQRVHYMVFDLPTHGGAFDARLNALQHSIHALNVPWVRSVQQMQLSNHAALTAKLAAVVNAGGEGLMLHRSSSNYSAGRSDNLLKLKPYDDAEAQVVGYLPGKGKYLGMVGALRVRTRNGLEFSIGSGLTDEQRRTPPSIGEWITYGHHGVTAKGIPRFAHFLRSRDDMNH